MDSKTINYIKELIKKLDNKFTVSDIKLEGSLNYDFYVENEDQRVKITFGRDIIEDFEIAIEKYAGTDYYHRLESVIKFRIYVALGQEGLIPMFDISSEILNEKRDWQEEYRAKVELGRSIYEILYRGLKKLSDFLDRTLKKHKGQGLELKEVEEEKEDIDVLIAHYEKNNSFDEDDASAKSLGFLKAAVVCDIIDKENIKRQGNISARILKEIDRTIYSTVAILREKLFLEAKLPDCIREYATENKREFPDSSLLNKDKEKTILKKYRKYTVELLMGFKRLCDNLPTQAPKQRIALGIAIVAEAGIKIKDYKSTYRSPLFGEIGAAFQEMLERNWIEEISVDENRKRDFLFEYEEQIMKICGGFYSDLEQMKKILSKERPLGDHWFKLTTKGEEIAENFMNPLTNQEKDRLDSLLVAFDPALNKKRVGAWETFKSNNPDRLSQSANSMVELMNQVIDGVCKDRSLSEYLKDKYGAKEEAKWVESMVNWISETKDTLQRVKHHADYKLENITETLLITAERIILIILE